MTTEVYSITVWQRQTIIATIAQIARSAWTLTMHRREPYPRTTTACTSGLDALRELYIVDPSVEFSCEMLIWHGAFLSARVTQLASLWCLQIVDPRVSRSESPCASPQEALEQYYAMTPRHADVDVRRWRATLG